MSYLSSQLGLAAVPLLGIVDVGLNLLKVLAIAGGASVGAVASGLLLRLIAKVSFSRKVPRIPLRVVQILGGTGLGVAVFYWAFGPGGSGFGGAGEGFGKGQGTSLSDDLDPEKTKQGVGKTGLVQDMVVPGAAVLRIEMLGGERVKGDRFYVLEGDKEARNLADLEKAIRSRRQDKEKPALERLEIVIYEESVAPDHPAVRDLERWAKQNDLSVSLWKPTGSSR